MKYFNTYYTNQYTEFSHLHLFLKEILTEKKDGFFVEIGAFDGETNSKTAHLADIGWKGIYVEPVKEYYLKCLNRHKSNNVQVLNMALSDKNGSSEIFKGGLPSTLKTNHKSYIEKFTSAQSSPIQFNSEKVTTITWSEFENTHCRETPDILVVDAEGYDLTIIESIDFSSFKPKIIFCEVFPDYTDFIDGKTIIEGHKIINHLKKHGYHIWLQEKHNILFSTKVVPKTTSECKALSIDSLLKQACSVENINNECLLPFLKQLLRTCILQKEADLARLYSDLISSHICIEDVKDMNLLIHSYLLSNNNELALKFIKHLIDAKIGTYDTFILKYHCELNLNLKEDAENTINSIISSNPSVRYLLPIKELNRRRINL